MKIETHPFICYSAEPFLLFGLGGPIGRGICGLAAPHGDPRRRVPGFKQKLARPLLLVRAER